MIFGFWIKQILFNNHKIHKKHKKLKNKKYDLWVKNVKISS